jgi:energy-coupling factor transporter ATP-binding protein EcfA2
VAPSTGSLPDEKQPTITAPETTGGADVTIDHLTWTPIRRRTPVLDDLSLTISAGQRVVIVGPSGAGKSTLLRAIAGLLLTAGHGRLEGSVRVDGREPGSVPGDVGLLMQDPTASVVAETVGRDVAFGLENRRMPRPEIWRQVHRALDAAGFPYDVGHPTSALSGGETQRLTLAGNLALGSHVLLLDEPTSMLDPGAATTVRQAIRADVERRGATTIIVEHHFEPWLDFADRLIVLGRCGTIVADGALREVLANHRMRLAAEGVWVPGLGNPTLAPVDEALVAPWLGVPRNLVTATDLRVELTASLVDRHRPPTVALDGVDASLTAGRCLAVTGASGAGKSTLVSVLAGLRRPTAGDVVSAPELATRKGRAPWRWTSRDLTARLSWAPQTPEHGVVTSTVREEVRASARASGRAGARADARADGLLETFGLTHLGSASPYHLSGGEQRRLMVVAALVHGPAGVLLDEPTVGQDRQTWATVLGAVAAARDAGVAVALSTHDADTVDALADDRLTLANGRVVR